ncbi:MAG: thiamine phosphate synthase [Candidatus Baltobacteraceae bacterium]
MAAAHASSAHPLLSGIYAIVNDTHPDPVALTAAVLAGGARIVQYRAKRYFNPAHAFAIRALTGESGALFLLNDRWHDLERFCADGAHVGPDDAPFEALPAIRARIGTRLLGVSCGTQREAQSAQASGADYLGVGAVFATASKNDAGPPIGMEGLRAIVRASALPVAAIGGITLQEVPQVRAAGAAMAAVISAISGAPDPLAATAALVRAWGACA